jgi:hyperosmotically inducible protein
MRQSTAKEENIMQGILRYVVAASLAGCLVSVQSIPASAAVSDAWITTKAKIALLTTKDISSTAINVDTVEGMVTLHGKVETPEEKAEAGDEVKKIDGVKEVRNLLQVVPSRHEKKVTASDSQVKDRVSKALKQDHALDKSSISVQSVNDGVVLLGGKAESASEHLRAIKDARAVPGVRGVASEVQSPDRLVDAEIRRGERSAPTAGASRGIVSATQDMWITTDTKARLLADSNTPALDINVDTWNGVVTLFGSVPSKGARAAAEADARKVSGVKRVVNELQVAPGAKKEEVKARDEDLKTAVKHALERRGELKDVDVDVKNGVVRLTGTVESEEQRLDAAIAARSTPGVRAVEDDLRISTATAEQEK